MLSVNSSGVQQTQDYPGVFTSFGSRLHYDATTGYVYSDDGQAVNPATGTPVGTYSYSGSGFSLVPPFMVPDGTLGYAYFVYQNAAPSSNYFTYTIQAYSLTHFTAAGSITLSNVVGTPVKIIRWGTNGLAILTQNQPLSQAPGAAVYVLSGSFVTAP